MISIVNYGLGNLGSIHNMFKKIGFDSKIIDKPNQIGSASKIILPGVGSFDTGMRNLIDGGWLEVLNNKVLVEKTPTLGICLGMQLMGKSSEEGVLNGLGWINAETKKFTFENRTIKVPHMGWNDCYSMKHSRLIQDNFKDSRFYFVHSYYVLMEDESDVLFKTNYGFEFTSAFEKENVIGMQFHPEKSHKYGLEILKNFAENY